MVRPRVKLLDDRSIGRDLSDLSDKDVAVVFDFYRYRKIHERFVSVLHEDEVCIVRREQASRLFRTRQPKRDLVTFRS